MSMTSKESMQIACKIDAVLTRKTVHTIQPSWTTSFVFDSDSVSIPHAELDGSKKEKLGKRATLEGNSLLGSLPASVDADSSGILVTESLLLFGLLSVIVGRVELLYMLALTVKGEGQDVLLASGLDSSSRKEIAERGVIHESFFGVRVDAQVRFDQVQVVVPVISPVSGSVDSHSNIFSACDQSVHHFLVADRNGDVEHVNKIKDLSRAERTSIEDLGQGYWKEDACELSSAR